MMLHIPKTIKKSFLIDVFLMVNHMLMITIPSSSFRLNKFTYQTIRFRKRIFSISTVNSFIFYRYNVFTYTHINAYNISVHSIPHSFLNV